jgi:two-component system chemotaxis family response regulator WspR
MHDASRPDHAAASPALAGAVSGAAAGNSAGHVKVLLVDDQPMIAEAVRRMLHGQSDIEFHFVTDGSLALAMAERILPNVILQDLIMPEVDGFALIGQYRASERLQDVPVIVLSAREDPKLKAHGFAVGANDYVTKLPDRLELLARVRYHAAGHISRLQRDAAFRFLRESERKLADANIELQKLAALDGLTGIANRRRFDEAMKYEWQRGCREQRPLSLVMCDIDCFKAYNDTYGHLGGDLCLKRTAAVLTEHLKRPADLVARYGGEEFAIVLPETEAEGALQVAAACRAHLEQLAIEHTGWAGKIVTLSLGVASLVPTPETSVEVLIARADQALYGAKQAGRNRVQQSQE